MWAFQRALVNQALEPVAWLIEDRVESVGDETSA